MADRAVAEVGGAAADRLHRRGRLRGRGGDALEPPAEISAVGMGEFGLQRRENIEHGLLADVAICRAP